jgi:hypothetical protein
MSTTTLRAVWNGHPVYLGDAWRLRKRNKLPGARSGRISSDGSSGSRSGRETQVCRSTEEILDTQVSWKAAMSEKGWS